VTLKGKTLFISGLAGRPSTHMHNDVPPPGVAVLPLPSDAAAKAKI
jgi:hypothetical protein